MGGRRDPAPPGPDALPARVLSATLAHELNNIVASLRGFVELGSEMSRDAPILHNIFGEVRLGAERAAMLAADLEVLGAASTGTRSVSLTSLVTAAGTGDARRGPDWHCDSRLTVLADPARGPQAIGVLQRLATHEPDHSAALRCAASVPAGVATPARCAGCGAEVGDHNAWLIQPLPHGRLRAINAAPGRAHPSTLQLRMGVLTQAAHDAGWHVVAISEPEALALVAPRT